jgi:ElaB/YqjD/DUF883 family membrane-anchored ribosome-binding protein
METTHSKNGLSKKSKRKAAEVEEISDMVTAPIEEGAAALHERVEKVRDMVEDFRDRAEMAFHERPYLLPVATGALGLGVGVLIGSKLSRVLFFTAAGALLSDGVRQQVARVSRDVLQSLGDKLNVDEGDGEDVEKVDDAEPSVT